MNIVSCPKGHFFNHDKYDVCPICFSPVLTIVSSGKEDVSETTPNFPLPEETGTATVTDTSYRSKGDD